ncbi:uncharacterized protein RNJ42_04031 [Nakaseomyces bracarensis]|uniref:uncharacterized protein n=1 Tax=Nakaseomyces bracarensis TaxID=273131 RepID=UPI0038726D85
MVINTLLVTATLVFIFFQSSFADALQGCLISQDEKSGLNVNVYEYDLSIGTELAYNKSYMAGGYRKHKLIGTSTAIDFDVQLPCADTSGHVMKWCYPDLSKNYSIGVKFYCEGESAVCHFPATASYYGINISTNNMTFEYTGYYKAPETGTYKLSLPIVDDTVAITMGAGLAFGCCTQGSSQTTNETFSITGMYPPDGKVFNFTLVKDIYYPIKVVYTNDFSWGMLKYNLLAPNGSNIVFTGSLFSFPDINNTTKLHYRK